MFGKNRKENEQLDGVVGAMLRAATATDAESEAAANAPFLFTRIRARIVAEKRRREEAGGWQSLPFVAWRAVPAMAIIAVLAAGLTIWTASPSNTANTNTPAVWYRLDDEALSDTSDPGVEQTILSRNNLSHDEIFSIVLGRNDRSKGR